MLRDRVVASLLPDRFSACRSLFEEGRCAARGAVSSEAGQRVRRRLSSNEEGQTPKSSGRRIVSPASFGQLHAAEMTS